MRERESESDDFASSFFSLVGAINVHFVPLTYEYVSIYSSPSFIVVVGFANCVCRLSTVAVHW